MVTEPCSVYYAGVDLRDVVLADGTVKRDILPEETFFKEGVLGIEFSGRNSFGKRVMGLCSPPVSFFFGFYTFFKICPLAEMLTHKILF